MKKAVLGVFIIILLFAASSTKAHAGCGVRVSGTCDGDNVVSPSSALTCPSTTSICCDSLQECPQPTEPEQGETGGPCAQGVTPQCASPNDVCINNKCVTRPAPGSGTKGAPCSDDLNITCNTGLVCTNNICSEIKAPPVQPGGNTSDTATKVGQGCPDEHINTAIGCIPLGDTNTMAAFFLRWGVGIAGGIALLMIGFASYKIATSQGDPRRLQGGQELLLSAIGGLLMVVLSVYLLRFMGINLLNIF